MTQQGLIQKAVIEMTTKINVFLIDGVLSHD